MNVPTAGAIMTLDLPENEQAVSVIAVGYGTKDAQMPKRKSVSDIAKFY